MEITLQELLDSRDARVEHQRKLASDYPRASLICFTVILPGPVKRDCRSMAVAKAGVRAILQSFAASSAASELLYREERDLETGFEAYFVVDLPAEAVKRLCCQIEDTHPLGRLMDIDVIVDSGVLPGMTEALPALRPLSRTEIGLPERSCLLCGRPARECMRSHAHTPEEIREAILKIILIFVRKL